MNTTHDKFNEMPTTADCMLVYARLTHDKFNEMPTTADCTQALDEANRSLDNAERFEKELELLAAITELREAERAAGRLKGVEKARASIKADAAAASLYLAIRKAVTR